jgi:hypothetical protein
MLYNLPYNVVKSVHVYKSIDENNALSREVKRKDYVMSVVLRIYTKSYIVNADGVIGINDRYICRLFGFRFIIMSS